jgi:hypothetical protein
VTNAPFSIGRTILGLMLIAVLALKPPVRATEVSSSAAVAGAEAIYADLADSCGILSAIDSGLFAVYQGKDRAAWQSIYREKRKQLVEMLSRISRSILPRSMPARSK